MGRLHRPERVKFFIGLLTAFPEVVDEVEEAFRRHFSSLGPRLGPLPFAFTDYYTPEMGSPLSRFFFALDPLFPAETLVLLKRWTNFVEELYSSRSRETGRWPVRRPVNLDPGYIEPSKVVLASTKNYSHRLYLGHGIFAEVTLQYRQGVFQALPWTYPDYQTRPYLDFFTALRQDLLKTPRLLAQTPRLRRIFNPLKEGKTP